MTRQRGAVIVIIINGIPEAVGKIQKPISIVVKAVFRLQAQNHPVPAADRIIRAVKRIVTQVLTILMMKDMMMFKKKMITTGIAITVMTIMLTVLMTLWMNWIGKADKK